MKMTAKLAHLRSLEIVARPTPTELRQWRRQCRVPAALWLTYRTFCVIGSLSAGRRLAWLLFCAAYFLWGLMGPLGIELSWSSLTLGGMLGAMSFKAWHQETLWLGTEARLEADEARRRHELSDI